MTKAFRASSVVKAIGCKHLELVAGEGYWYFVYDDVANGVYETQSVSVCRLSHMAFDQWVEDGKDFIKTVQEIDKPDSRYNI